MKLVKRYIAERPEYIVALHIDDCPIPAPNHCVERPTFVPRVCNSPFCYVAEG